MSDLIILDNQQYNNYSNPSPPFQSWDPYETIVYFDAALGGIAPFTVDYQVKDYIGIVDYNLYSEFKLDTERNYEPATTLNIFPNNIGVNPWGNNNQYPLTANGTIISETFSSNNTHLLANGTYILKTRFTVFGKNQSNVWEELEWHVHRVKLIKTQSIVTFTPQNIAIIHTQNAPFVEYDIEMNGDNWRLESTQAINGQDRVVLFTTDPSVTITTLPNGGTIAEGTGNKIVKAKLSNYYDTVTAPGYYELNKVIFVFASYSTTSIGFINVNINVLINTVMEVEPLALTFNAIKTISEPLSQFAKVVTNQTITVAHAPWLVLVPSFGTIGTSIGLLPGYTIVPIPTTNMSAGIYTDIIVFSAVVSGQTYQKTINVTYNLTADVVSPYQTNRIAFTLNYPQYYEFFTQTLNTYFDLNLILKVYYFDGTDAIKNVNLKVGMFNKKAKEYLGKIIHNLLYTSTYGFGTNAIKPAELIIEIKERDKVSNQIIRSITTVAQKFIAGFSNWFYTQWLHSNRKTKRVYPNQSLYLSYYCNEASHLYMDCKINETLQPSFPVFYDNSGTERIQTRRLQVTQQKGDKLEFRIANYDPSTNDLANVYFADEQTEKFVVFPEPKFWTEIGWIDEFKLFQNFIFGGSFTIESEKEFVDNRTFNGVFETLQRIDVTSVKKITINTGWCLKTDEATINSILESKKVWLIKSINNFQEIYEVTPLSKKIVHENTELQTISFNVEFEIAPIR